MTCHLRHFLMIETNQNLFLLNLVSMEKVEVLPILRIGSFFLFCASFSACALALSYCSIAPFFLPKKNNVYIMLHLRASNNINRDGTFMFQYFIIDDTFHIPVNAKQDILGTEIWFWYWKWFFIF